MRLDWVFMLLAQVRLASISLIWFINDKSNAKSLFQQ